MKMLQLTRARYQRLRRRFERRKYTPSTFAEYLRSCGAQVGEGCFIASMDLDIGIEPYLLKIGNHVAIAGEVSVMTHDGAPWVFRDQVSDLQVFGPVVIDDNCFIGYRAMICPNVRIGPNSIVAAGSVVISDVPPNTLVMGVPARPFGSVDRYREKCLQRWAEQRPGDIVIEPGETWWNSRHFSANRERLRHHLLNVFRHQLSSSQIMSPSLRPAGITKGESSCVQQSG
jgi:acetyltransferase-like isoleucine patch superfamily enzyme